MSVSFFLPGLGVKEHSQIVAQHNRLRSWVKPMAANMQKMVCGIYCLFLLCVCVFECYECCCRPKCEFYGQSALYTKNWRWHTELSTLLIFTPKFSISLQHILYVSLVKSYCSVAYCRPSLPSLLEDIWPRAANSTSMLLSSNELSCPCKTQRQTVMIMMMMVSVMIRRVV